VVVRSVPDAPIYSASGDVRPGDVALVMSNGDFEGIWDKRLAALRARC
jgi:hypothetical protein